MQDAGAAYMFVGFSIITPSFESKYTADTYDINARLPNDQFGRSAAISPTTSSIVFGANYQDYDSNGTNRADDAGVAWTTPVFASPC